jgi:hypothetical protein
MAALAAALVVVTACAGSAGRATAPRGPEWIITAAPAQTGPLNRHEIGPYQRAGRVLACEL